MDEPKGAGPLDEQPGVVKAPPKTPAPPGRQPATQSTYRTAINIVAFIAVALVVVTLALLILPLVH